MTTSDWVMIFAVLVAPVLAVQVQKWIERLRERRQRKLQLFQTLLSTRTARVAPAHVQALNMIDIEFAGPRFLHGARPSESEKAVLDAWRVYRDLLSDESSFKDESGFHRREGAFVDLLLCMAKDLGYEFDKVYLRKGAYTPVAYGDFEADQHKLRAYILEVMEGKRAITVLSVTSADLGKAPDQLSDPAQHDGVRRPPNASESE